MEEDKHNYENSPEVIVYRVKKLEEAVEHGFKEVNDKLDKLSGFVTKEESEKIIQDEWAKARLIHRSLENRINEIEQWKDNIVNKIAGSAVIGLIMMVLALYGLDKFFT